MSAGLGGGGEAGSAGVPPASSDAVEIAENALVGEGQGIRWPDLDEDLSVEGLIAGRPSGESQRSFKRWLEAKRAGRSVALYDSMDADRSVDGE